MAHGAGIAPGLVLDEDRLQHRLLGSVPWSEVQAVEMTRWEKRCRFYVRLVSGGRIRRSGLSRWLLRKKDHLLFPIEGFDVPPNQVLATARGFHQAAGAGLPPRQPQLSGEALRTMAELEQMADRDASIPEMEAMLRNRADAVTANVDEEFRLRQQVLARRGRWANRILVLLMGLLLGWGLFKLAPAFGWR